jgi:hypothetical protein
MASGLPEKVEVSPSGIIMELVDFAAKIDYQRVPSGNLT